jgi:hypothetical protein
LDFHLDGRTLVMDTKLLFICFPNVIF